ncbi:hypothetical protein [Streptomyces sp. ISL-100]|uniref:hypothetical protein n=1 Tax=Streptomyces sp. ISL-100 TaxID=2819173 RepID=UPI001BEBC410|nr:hypothetical protein [Streptomyces sp. ISL-100]MBT2398111.1 hypothetical protein [Streptomyces sp. ISL-100]
MSLQEDLAAVQRSLDNLVQSVERVEQQVGGGSLEIRRVRTDAGHLRESVALLNEAAPTLRRAEARPDLVAISDDPYNSALWTDSDDEGLGARDRHAP